MRVSYRDGAFGRAGGVRMLLPYRRFEIHSPHSAEQAERIVAAAVEAPRWFRFGSGARPFEGKVGGAVFAFRRIIRYRNSFLPEISGRIASQGSGSRVSITMRLNVVVAAFLLVWFGGVLVGAVAMTFAVADGSASPALVLVPIGMLLFGWALTAGSFAVEAKKATELLNELLGAGSSPTATADRA